MKWKTFQTKLNLDEVQAKEMLIILNHYKEQFTELCTHVAESGGVSPFEYASKLHLEDSQIDEKTFSNKFLSFLSNQRDSISKKTFLEKGNLLETSIQEKLTGILNSEQNLLFQSLEIESLQNVETGYDPFGDKLTEEIVNKSEFKVEQTDNKFFSKTFCILPWIHTFVDVNGDVKLCCYATVGSNNRQINSSMNLQLKPFNDIWNSSYMRNIRSKMIEGEKVDACSICNRQAELGQTTYSSLYNNRWLVEDPEHHKWEKRVYDSMKNNYDVQILPINYDLRPGNICSLKCRMCHSDYSNLIQKDPIHNKWAYHGSETKDTRFSDGTRWYESDSVITDELLENIHETRSFYLAGGEPLINPFIKKLIDYLIERNVAHKIKLEISSNLTVFDDDFLNKLSKFKWVHMSLSIDGIGPVFNYIRYPGKWTDIDRNLKKLRHLPNFSFVITATIQNYNILSINDLLDYAESLEISCNLNLLNSPIYLSVAVMPQKARLLALKRLKDFVDKSLMVKQDKNMKVTIDNAILELDQDSEKIYRSTIHEFMVFTNDLDRSRNQSFKATFPELYRFIVEDGLTWTDEVRHYVSQKKEMNYSL